MRALILAAGFGTRLKSTYLGYDGAHKSLAKSFIVDSTNPGSEQNPNIRQKGLVLIHDKPIVDYQLQQLTQAGILLDDIHVHTNEEYLAQYRDWAREKGIPLQNISGNGVVSNDQRLEVMGDLLLSFNRLGSVTPLVVMASDTLVYEASGQLYGLLSMVQAHKQDRISRVVAYQKEYDLQKHGIIEVDSDQNVLGFEEKPEVPKSNLVNVSIYIFSASHLARILGEQSTFATYKSPLELLATEFKMEQVDTRLDLGTIEDVMKANGLESIS
jgi:NDP-sugar pyrophosphorylase family protein